MAISKTVQKVKKAVVNATSDAIVGAEKFFGAVPNDKKAAVKATQDVNDIKMVRQAKGTQDQGNYTDPLFRARANVSNLRQDAQDKADKAEKQQKQVVAKKVAAKPSSYSADYAAMRSGKKTIF